MAWFGRVGALLTGLVIGVLVPAVAWASETGVADELVRRRPRIGGFGLFGTFCCLAVLVVVLVLVMVMMRNRRRR